ncbi:MAG: hypothetical protein KAS72_10045 [Phycisphaerales bacterium]|nr:hypothetical protein [Phycisphaerales bacterium]
MPESTASNPAESVADEPSPDLDQQVLDLLERVDHAVKAVTQQHSDEAPAAEPIQDGQLIADDGTSAAEPDAQVEPAPPVESAEPVDDATSSETADQAVSEDVGTFDDVETVTAELESTPADYAPDQSAADESDLDAAVDAIVDTTTADDSEMSESIDELVAEAERAEGGEEPAVAVESPGGEAFDTPEVAQRETVEDAAEPVEPEATFDAPESEQAAESEPDKGEANEALDENIESLDETLAAEAEQIVSADAFDAAPTASESVEDDAPAAVEPVEAEPAHVEPAETEQIEDVAAGSFESPDEASVAEESDAPAASTDVVSEQTPDQVEAADALDADFETIDNVAETTQAQAPADEPQPDAAPTEPAGECVEATESPEPPPTQTDTAAVVEAEVAQDVKSEAEQDQPKSAAQAARKKQPTKQKTKQATPSFNPKEIVGRVKAMTFADYRRVTLQLGRTAAAGLGALIRRAVVDAPVFWAQAKPKLATALYHINAPYRRLPADMRDFVGWAALVTAFMAFTVWFILILR